MRTRTRFTVHWHVTAEGLTRPVRKLCEDLAARQRKKMKQRRCAVGACRLARVNLQLVQLLSLQNMLSMFLKNTTNTSSRSSTSFVGSWAVDVHHFRLFTSVTCTHLAVRDAPGHCQCTATSCTLQTLSGARGKLVVFCLDSWSEQLTMRFVPWCTHGFWFFCFSLGLVCPPVPAATPASWRKSCQH